MGHTLSKWFVEGVNQAHELGFPFVGDLNFPWLLITTFGTFTFWTPPKKKWRWMVQMIFLWKKWVILRFQPLIFRGVEMDVCCRKLMWTMEDVSYFQLWKYVYNLYSLPSMKKHVSIATHVLKKPMQLFFFVTKKTHPSPCYHQAPKIASWFQPHQPWLIKVGLVLWHRFYVVLMANQLSGLCTIGC